MGIKNKKLAFIDIETTGLLLNKHEIIELGCVLARQNTFEIIEEFDIKIKPERIEDADEIGLKVNGYNEKDWENALPLKQAMEIFAGKTNGAIMVAHNISFDSAFLERAFEITGIENKMHYQKLDTVSIAFAKLYKNKKVERFSLSALCEYFNIENKKAHTALSDARATYELYKHLMI